MRKDLPFLCPSCGKRFGTGPSAVLLSICKGETSFDENLPCCGVHATGIVFVNDDGYMEIKEMAVAE